MSAICKRLGTITDTPDREGQIASTVHCYPQTWLLRVGWERHGLIGACEIPGPIKKR